VPQGFLKVQPTRDTGLSPGSQDVSNYLPQVVGEAELLNYFAHFDPATTLVPWGMIYGIVGRLDVQLTIVVDVVV